MALKCAVIGLLSFVVLATPVAAQDERYTAPESSAAPADSSTPADSGETNCESCPPPKKYDSQEVIKTTRDVDRSRVINTTTVVPVPPKVRERNHLVIHENETRNVGVILHKNTIIEKEIRYRRPRVAAAQTYAVLNPETGEPMWLLYPTSNGYRSVPAGRQLNYGFGRFDCGCHWWER